MVDTSWALVNHCGERARKGPEPGSGKGCGDAVKDNDIWALFDQTPCHSPARGGGQGKGPRRERDKGNRGATGRSGFRHAEVIEVPPR
jgi:hypothetical protein